MRKLQRYENKLYITKLTNCLSFTFLNFSVVINSASSYFHTLLPRYNDFIMTDAKHNRYEWEFYFKYSQTVKHIFFFHFLTFLSLRIFRNIFFSK